MATFLDDLCKLHLNKNSTKYAALLISQGENEQGFFFPLSAHPEEEFGHGFFGQLSWRAQVLVQVCVHHARVHSVSRYWIASGPQPLLQVVGEKHQGQFTLRVRTMGTVTRPETERCRKSSTSKQSDFIEYTAETLQNVFYVALDSREKS